MSLTSDYIIQQLEEFNESIREALASKKINNTKEASDSLRIEIDKQNNIFRSIGIFYLEFLDTGRGHGKHPPFNPISEWVAIKLGITDIDENKRVTFAIMNKIAKLGTEIFRNNSEGIELEKKVVTLHENISSNLSKIAKTEVLQGLDKYKKLFKEKRNYSLS